MEKFPSTPTNKAEELPEKVLSSEEILEAISTHVEGYTPGRELSDERGTYLQEVEVRGEKEGEVTEYQYMRKGKHGNNNESDVTAISVIYYQDGIPVGGERIAVFNDRTGAWIKS
ncbi:MAG: hypothetical protein AAB582_03775 [Patescibacteria group bacterium]